MWTDFEVIFQKLRQQSHYAQENQNQIFHDFPWTPLTFQNFKAWNLQCWNSITLQDFHDLWEPCYHLTVCEILVSGHEWKQFVPYVTKHTTVECLRDHFYVTIYFDWRNESFAHHLEDRVQCVHASLRSTIANIYHYVQFIIYVLFVIIFFKKTYFAREQWESTWEGFITTHNNAWEWCPDLNVDYYKVPCLSLSEQQVPLVLFLFLFLFFFWFVCFCCCCCCFFVFFFARRQPWKINRKVRREHTVANSCTSLLTHCKKYGRPFVLNVWR